MRSGVAQATCALTRSLLLLALFAFSGNFLSVYGGYPVPTNAPAGYPAWWFQRGVIVPLDAAAVSSQSTLSWPGNYPASDDYSVMNQGQLKNLAAKADAELESQLPAAVLSQSNAVALQSLIASWSNSSNADNYAVVNQGQLKALAQQFYDVLGSASYTAGLGLPPAGWTNGAYPWSSSTNAADSYAVANIGQAKYLFSFNLTSSNGQTPVWEAAYLSAAPTNGSSTTTTNGGGTGQQTYSATLQAEIAKHQWTPAQAARYLALQSNNPNMLTTGLTIWFKADAGVTVTNGTAIAWADQTGNYRVTQAGGNAPTYVTNVLNGMPVVSLSGGQGLINPSQPADPGLNADMTIITVVATTNPWATQESFALGDGAGRRGLGYQWAQQFLDAGGAAFQGWSASSAGSYSIEAMSLDPTLTKVSLYCNGTLTTNAVISGVTAIAPGLFLGEKSLLPDGWQGSIAEILVYDHQLSTGEMAQVTQYLVGKYGRFTPDAAWPVISSGTTHATSSSSPGAASSMVVSMGLNGLADYSTAQQFLDVMKYARVWQTHNAINLTNTSGASLNAWSTGLGSTIPMDHNGWPTQIPFSAPNVTSGQPDPNNVGDLLAAQQSVFTLVNVQVPGSYRLRFRGTGSLHLYGPSSANTSWTATFGTNEIAALPVDSNGMSYFDTPAVALSTDANGVPYATLTLGIDSSSGTNYLRDIEIVTPGYATTNLTSNPFNPAYLATLQGYNTLRMMGWGNINSSLLTSWTNRTLPTTYTQSQPTGVALEYMIMICNQLGENLWLNIPTQAGQEYVRQAARVILHGAKNNGAPFAPGFDAPGLRVWPALNPGLKVYLEYSNETWNASFPQAAYVVTQGAALRALGLPFSSDNYTAGEQFAAYQSANIWEWFYEEWGTNAPQRIVRVMAGLMDTNFSNVRLAAFQIPGLISVNQKPDVLAVAPYFGGSVADQLVSSGQLATATTAQVLQAAGADITNNILPTMVSLKAVADHYGIWLNCYESGQGLVATGANVGNTNLTSLLLEANHDPGMGALYISYLTGLASAGVVEVTHAADMGEDTMYGSWSVLEYLTQPLTSAYKYQALMTWISNNPASNANLPPTISITYPPSVIDSTGTGWADVPLSLAASGDYDDSIASVSWNIDGTNYPGMSISPSLPVGENTITATATNSHGESSSQTIQVTVRPAGSDTVLVQSDFTGSAPAQHIPWTNTSLLSSSVIFSGWTYPGETNVPGIGLMGIGGGTTNNNVFGIALDGRGGLPEIRSTLTDAVADNEYLSCTITPTAGHSLDLRGALVQWTLNSLDSDSAQQCDLMTSISGFAAGSQIYQSAPFNLTGNPESDTFSASLPFTDAYAHVSGPLELRIYLTENCFSAKVTELAAFKLVGALK